MCGIVGVWDLENRTENLTGSVEHGLNTVGHRGPDARGVWTKENLGLCLGHCRLAIQDLSEAGHQPMLSRSGRYVLVFNGEIYNFLELREDLARLGHEFTGSSDTEVMLAAFEEWGIKRAVSKFSGMFAFGLFDQKEERLWLARDRMGEKPLYYYYADNKLVFCSELKGILSQLDKKLELDWDEISHYFRFGYFYTDATPFTSVKKLPPAAVLCLAMNDGKCPESLDELNSKIETYWHSEPTLNWGEGPGRQDADYINRFEQLLTHVITQQSISDVALGVFLSGGIDSTLVATYLQKISATPVNTFTVSFEHPTYNEAQFAKSISDHLGTHHHEIKLGQKECINRIEEILSSMDEPFADASFLPTYMICKEARKNVTVCLSGDGGDELFAGYNRYHWGGRVDALNRKLPYFIRQPLGKGIEKIPRSRVDKIFEAGSSIIAQGETKPEKDFGIKLHKLARVLQCRNSTDLYLRLLEFWPDSPVRKDLGRFITRNHHGKVMFRNSFITDAMALDQVFYLPCDNLFKVDRAAMASSLEVRLPLLDNRIVEFANALPEHLKYRSGVTKWIMRELIYKEIPKQLIERPKMGFSVPLSDWLTNELRQWVTGNIDDRDLISACGVDFDVVQETWKQHLSGKRDHSNAIWTLLMYTEWFKKYSASIEAVAD